MIMKTDTALVAEFYSISFTISASLLDFRLRLVMVDMILEYQSGHSCVRSESFLAYVQELDLPGSNFTNKVCRMYRRKMSNSKFGWSPSFQNRYRIHEFWTDMSTVQVNNGNHHFFDRIEIPIRYFEIFWSAHLSTPPMFLLYWWMIYGSGTMMCLFSDELYLETLVTGLTPTASNTFDRDFIGLLTGCLLLVMPSFFFPNCFGSTMSHCLILFGRIIPMVAKLWLAKQSSNRNEVK